MNTVESEHERLTRFLHSKCLHPDYEYEMIETARKSGDRHPPTGRGWEVNVDKDDGFMRFEYTEENYWRRLRSYGDDEDVNPFDFEIDGYKKWIYLEEFNVMLDQFDPDRVGLLLKTLEGDSAVGESDNLIHVEDDSDSYWAIVVDVSDNYQIRVRITESGCLTDTHVAGYRRDGQLGRWHRWTPHGTLRIDRFEAYLNLNAVLNNCLGSNPPSENPHDW